MYMCHKDLYRIVYSPVREVQSETMHTLCDLFVALALAYTPECSCSPNFVFVQVRHGIHGALGVELAAAA